jgi:hypothetical protein
MSRAITYHFVEGERGIVSQRIDRTRTPIGANCSAGSQVIFSRRECTRRMVRLMFSNRATVFDQAPIVLLTAECAAHWHLASAKHDEIAGRGRTRELDAGLDAHRGTPLSTLACRCVTSASLSVEKQTRSGKAPDCVFAPSLLSVVQPRRRSHHGSCARPATHAAPPRASSSPAARR